MRWMIWLLIGLVAGGIARLVVPGRHPIGCLGTIALGIAGAVVAGFLADVLLDSRGGVGFLGATIGAILVLAFVRIISAERRPRT